MPSRRTFRGLTALALAAIVGLGALPAAPADAKKRKKKRAVPSTQVVKKLMIERWDTEFEKNTGAAVTLKFERIRRARPRRSGPENLLIPYGTKIYPVQITMLQTAVTTIEDIELSSPFVGPTGATTTHTDVTRIVQQAFYYKADFGWTISPAGATTELISRT